MSAAGALVGAMAAGGVLLATAGVMARRAPSLADRIAPYLEGPSASTVARDDAGVRVDASTLERLMAPALRSAAARLHALLGGGDCSPSGCWPRAATAPRPRRSGSSRSPGPPELSPPQGRSW